MSYCRFSDGDVYMFEHVGGGIECCGCRLVEDRYVFPRFSLRSQAIAHLESPAGRHRI